MTTRVIDLTPKGLETQEGIARCNAAMAAQEAAHKALRQWVQERYPVISRTLSKSEPELATKLDGLIAAISDANHELCCSISGRPPEETS